MFGTHDLWLFAITVLVLNATPGVDMMFTLTRTLQHGVRGGVAAALGISAGCVVHALAAAFGLAAAAGGVGAGVQRDQVGRRRLPGVAGLGHAAHGLAWRRPAPLTRRYTLEAQPLRRCRQRWARRFARAC